ncbi:indole-3-glycerol phosphate synthase TrpC [Aquibacillus sp. 3ASR75-11]|uniref:Indole-3-glycerol phosphate synthase n=1 Tax=Terrihalobacillus insolitus TaxID=2950438 RepID=A0A9X4ANB3_9BACI|nr:indole-3-glycerol phosphate synthase TrpC [Terrihalobacillus insolitus]MDC3425649.1 indole-3-glycerol phosphate synthase TrpC [Terrihalobacillus insolitus]
MTILDQILQEKEKEVRHLKATFTVDSTVPYQKRSLFDRFQQSDRMNIIAEIKRSSPSRGIINQNVDPRNQAKDYETSGAGAISVLTDEPFFKGTMEDLRAVREEVNLPILCKDFIIDEIQINRAKQYGANVILLIVAALSKERLQALFTYARGLDLEVLVEVHNEQELELAQETGATIIGINNRNLKTFEVDLAITERLAGSVNSNETLLISESGFRSTEDVARVKQNGVKGILVGETMMRSENLQHTFDALRVNL